MPRVERSPPTMTPKQQNHSDTDSSSLASTETKQCLSNQRNKRRRESGEDRFNDFKTEILALVKELSENQTAMLNKLVKDVAEIKVQNSKIQESNKEIERSLEFLSHQYDEIKSKIENLEQERRQHILQISTLESKLEDIERNLKSSTIEIRNLPPAAKTETRADLCRFATVTCKALNIGIKENDIKNIYRLKDKSGKSTVITEFLCSSTKHEVIKAAKLYNKQNSTQRLNSATIGLEGETVPIYVSEALTSKGRRLLYLARDLVANKLN